MQAKVGTLQEVSKEVVIGLAALDDVVNEGVMSEVWEPVLQGLGRLGLVSFEALFNLR